jgi:hypothetical protein
VPRPMSMTTKPMSLQCASYIVSAVSLLGFSAFHCGFAAQSDFVRFSKPELLTFDQLVDLEKNDPSSPALAEKLEHLVTTPFLSNEAYFNGAKPKRPSSPQLGPFLRAICWNIERGIQFDPIRIALSEPEKFDQDPAGRLGPGDEL